MNADPGPEPSADDRESAYELLQRGLALTRRRHHAQAAIVLARAARAEPRKGSILEPLGRAYHLTRQYDLARETFELLLEVDPLNHWAHFALAESLRHLGRPGAARTHLRLAIAMAPRSELYRRALARLDAISPPATEPARPRSRAPRHDPGDVAEAGDSGQVGDP